QEPDRLRTRVLGRPHPEAGCIGRTPQVEGIDNPVPLSPFLPTYEAEKFFVAPGLLATVSSDENEAVVSFGALHRGALTPLLEHGFHWFHFDG
ncbi:hypothetical protein, partial [Streptomyces sp. NPDC060054]|uniref:hypothetical protein n=1 Tax=Streptomyces sp. NPDC060054 TaxID=3347048 RepID=UPI00369FD730